MKHATKLNGARARKMLANGTRVIQVCNPITFRDFSVKGAVNVPLRRINFMQTVEFVKTDPIIVVGEDETDVSSLQAAINYMTNYGYTKIFYVPSHESW